MPYVGGAVDAFYCPANPPGFRFTNKVFYDVSQMPSQANKEAVEPWYQGRSYGYNAVGTEQPSPFEVLGLGFLPRAFHDKTMQYDADYVAESMIRAPADMIALGDSNSDFHSDDVMSATFRATPGSRHSKGANVAFCDGHLEWQLTKKWVAMTPEARRRWNRDNEPHPETWDEVRNGWPVVPED
jgi:prepilin-type processing-associated H-X9-DG protein